MRSVIALLKKCRGVINARPGSGERSRILSPSPAANATTRRALQLAVSDGLQLELHHFRWVFAPLVKSRSCVPKRPRERRLSAEVVENVLCPHGGEDNGKNNFCKVLTVRVNLVYSSSHGETAPVQRGFSDASSPNARLPVHSRNVPEHQRSG